MRPIPVEDREKIINHKTNGESEKNIAKWLMIGHSTVYQILALYKKTGSIQPKPYKGNNHTRHQNTRHHQKNTQHNPKRTNHNT